MTKVIAVEGDKCPECNEGTVTVINIKPMRMKCTICGATYNDRGERVPCDNATAGY